jgi:hypothetical protein
MPPEARRLTGPFPPVQSVDKPAFAVFDLMAGTGGMLSKLLAYI